MTIDVPSCIRPFALPGDRRHFEKDVPFTLRHLRLDVTLDFESRSVAGTVRLTLLPVTNGTSEVHLDAREMRVTAVRGREGEPLRFTHANGGLRVALPGPFERGRPQEIEVAYQATPRRGLYFVSRDQAWTQGEAEDTRYWFPCLDLPSAKSTSEVRVTVPSGLFALSNGVLVEEHEDPTAGRKTFHWRHDVPHPAYLVSLAVGPFAEVVDDRNGIQIRYYVPADRVGDARRAFGRTPEMIERFSSLLGVPYPYPKYAQVVVDDFIFGGMENTTATTMHRFVLLDERAAIDFTADHIVAHELAHQWFGDLVTCREWSEGWLNEGFATFFESVDLEHHEGREEAAFYRMAEVTRFIEEDSGRYRRAIVERTYREPIDLFDRHLYEKAGAVLHMLRRKLGEEGFWRSIQLYLERHRGGAVETTDLVRAIEETTGRSIRRFFDQWVHSAGFPELEAIYAWDGDARLARLTIRQKRTEGTNLFHLELPVFFGKGSARECREIVVAEEHETFAFALPFEPERVVIDPWEDVLGRIKLDPGREMLLTQLREEPEAPARARAAEVLGAAHGDLEVLDALGASLASDRFWAVQAAAATALGETRSGRALEILASHTSVAHPKARRAVAKALGNFRDPGAARALQAMLENEPSWFVNAEALRSLGKTRVPDALDTLVRALDQDSYEDQIRVGALDGLAEKRDDRAIPIAMERTGAGHYATVRSAACRTLGKLGENKSEVREQLQRVLDDSDLRVRIAALRALGELGDPRALGAIDRVVERDLDGRVVRVAREVARDLGTGRRWTDELGALRDTVEKTRQAARALEDRVALLEARLKKEA
ncbi:MAG: HEAT repeat domain-containing protein [Deltaproteobacteria bacterium]|nr:HEAT repeat domain-containing protein [Deltaproteobacteria bacterium]